MEAIRLCQTVKKAFTALLITQPQLEVLHQAKNLVLKVTCVLTVQKHLFRALTEHIRHKNASQRAKPACQEDSVTGQRRIPENNVALETIAQLELVFQSPALLEHITTLKLPILEQHTHDSVKSALLAKLARLLESAIQKLACPTARRDSTALAALQRSISLMVCTAKSAR
jgi:hypothetical protein